ncbi:MAG: GNAT family N-acetyltransferase [Acidobacteriaceae bacterium]
MEFRFAVESDLPSITALVNQAFVVERLFKSDDRLNPGRTAEYFQKGRFLLAEDHGALIGCVYVELRGDRGYLGLLSVAPSVQKTGLGRRLAAAAEEFAREMGAHHMDLTVVNLRTELPPIYEKLGYVISGEEPVPEEIARRVSQPCHFVRMSKPLGNG